MSIDLIRRRVAGAATAALAVALTMSLAAPSLASASPAAPSAPSGTRATSGLFGSADATYDGVYRQSMALLGLSAASASLPAPAVAWLVGQQCADGSFQAFRADPSAPCSAPDPAAFTGPDSNSTALAAMALTAAGRSAQARRAVASLTTRQNADGGWGYTLGGASDVNSTGLALAAISGAPTTRVTRSAITRATSYLAKAQIGCTAPVTSRFGLPYQPGQNADVLASAQGLIGLAGTLPARPGRAASVRAVTCSDSTTRQVASFLDRAMRRTDGAIPSVLDSTKTDWNTTANAVIGLAAAGGASRAVAVGLRALGDNQAAYIGQGAGTSPAAVGTLIQAATASGADPRSFGRGAVNLVSRLLATLQK